jgi:enoyl-CoA hydratase/carnithine racemase
MTSGVVRLDIDGGLAVLSLDQAGTGNLLDEQMLIALLEGANRLQRQGTARAVLIKSSGRELLFRRRRSAIP